MPFVIIADDGGIIRYPYSVGSLIIDNPDQTIRATLNDAELANYRMYRVEFVEPPSYDILTQDIVELAPVQVDGKWVMRWEVINIHAEETGLRLSLYRSIAHKEAGRLLEFSQKYVLEGYEKGIELSAEFRAYRDSLRNPESLEGFPMNTQWPVLPENLFSENN